MDGISAFMRALRRIRVGAKEGVRVSLHLAGI